MALLTDSQQAELSNIKNDLKWQLTFEDIDWVYFIETALRCKEIEDYKIDEEEVEEVTLTYRYC